MKNTINKTFKGHLMFLISSIPFLVFAQVKQENDMDILQRIEKINSLWLSDSISIKADIVLTSGFTGLPSFDSISMPVTYIKLNDQIYGKFGDQEWIENDSLWLMVDLQQKVMKMVIKPVGSNKFMNEGIGLFSNMDSLKSVFGKKVWNSGLIKEDDYETLRLTSKDFLVEKQWPIAESSIKVNLLSGLPQSINNIERKMQLIDSTLEESWIGDNKPLIVNTLIENKSKQLSSFTILENRSFYFFSHINIKDSFNIPVNPFDRVQRDADGFWKAFGAYESYDLIFEEN